jgi:hypothetical protein
VARQVTPQSLEALIASGRLDPVYVLVGPDDALKAMLVTRLVESIEEDLRPFNVDKLFPPDHREEARRQFWTVLQLARTLPMMAPRRVIVVAQAEKLMQIFKAGDDEAPEPVEEAPPGRKGRKAVQKAAGEAELEAFEQYLSSPSPDAVLVFVAGQGLNRNLKPVRLLEKLATMVDCDPLPGGGHAVAWVKAEAAVREIASAPTTQSPWAMTNAIERGSTGEALRELALKIDAGEYPPMILGQIRWFVANKLAPSRVPAAVDALFRTDLALKTSGGDSRVLLERLVVELCG